MKRQVTGIAVLLLAMLSITAFADVSKLLTYVPEGTKRLTVVDLDNVRDFLPFSENTIKKTLANNPKAMEKFQAFRDKIEQHDMLAMQYNINTNDIFATCTIGKGCDSLTLVETAITAQQLEAILNVIPREFNHGNIQASFDVEKNYVGNKTVYCLDFSKDFSKLILAELCKKSCNNTKMMSKFPTTAFITFIDTNIALCSTNEKVFLNYLNKLQNGNIVPASLGEIEALDSDELVFFHKQPSTVPPKVDKSVVEEMVTNPDVAKAYCHKKLLPAFKMYLLFNKDKNEFTFNNIVKLKKSSSCSQMLTGAMLTFGSLMKMHGLDFTMQQKKDADNQDIFSMTIKGDVTFAEKVKKAIMLMKGHHSRRGYHRKKQTKTAPSTSTGLTIRKEN